jgi:hypothetical protein
MVLSPAGILAKGLHYLRLDHKQQSEANKAKSFHKHYGSSPLVLATMSHDMTATTIPEAQISDKELCERGFRMFLVAHFFLWTYPKNSSLIASRFDMCDNYLRGEPIWKWIRKIAAMKGLKIRWDPRLDSPESEIFVVTVDGTDFRIWERKHPTMNQDRRQCSKKFNHAAAKYKIAVSVFTSKVVWINGPFQGGLHDMTMMREGNLMNLIVEGKKAIVDRGYRSGVDAERAKLSLPNAFDPPVLNNMKSCA